MIIPFSEDIRKIHPVSEGNELIVSLSDIVESLPLSSKLIKQLRDFSYCFEEASLHIFSEASNKAKYEGRGRYSSHEFGDHPVQLYTKGAGSMGNLLCHSSRGNFGKLVGFGPNLLGEYLFDNDSHRLHFPRIYGAEFTYDAAREFLHALRIMVDIINNNGIESIDELLERGITIPVSVAKFDDLTSYLRPRVESQLNGTWKWNDDVRLGSVTLAVPSNTRTDIRRTQTISGNEICDYIAKTIRSLYIFSKAIYSSSSSHPQNFYIAPNSISPQADNSDILFDLEPEDRMNLFAHSIGTMMIGMSNNFDWAHKGENLDFYRFVDIILGNESHFPMPSTAEEVYGILKYVASELESYKTEQIIPSDALISTGIDPRVYERIEEKRKLEAKSKIQETGINNICSASHNDSNQFNRNSQPAFYIPDLSEPSQSPVLKPTLSGYFRRLLNLR